MKTLLFARHGKSSWDDPTKKDYDRPLLKKGIEKTIIAGQLLAKKSVKIERIYSSSAERAKNTALLLAKEIDYPVEEIIFDKFIYHADAEQLLTYCYSFPEEINTVMIVGHNPTLTDLYNYLSINNVEELNTSNIGCVVLGTNQWNSVAVCKKMDDWVIKPRRK